MEPSTTRFSPNSSTEIRGVAVTLAMREEERPIRGASGGFPRLGESLAFSKPLESTRFLSRVGTGRARAYSRRRRTPIGCCLGAPYSVPDNK